MNILFGVRYLLPAAVIAVPLGLALSSIPGDSVTIDEVTHITAGYAYLTKQDFRMNPEHPPLVKDVAALPLLFLDVKQDAFKNATWSDPSQFDQYNFGLDMLFQTGNDADRMTNPARSMMLLFFLLACILVFGWAKKLYGYWPAVVALILFAFSPTVLAHSRLVTTDVPAAWGILTATYFFIRFLHRPTAWKLAIAGLFFGLAQLTKFSAMLLVPFFLLTALWYAYSRPSAEFGIFKSLTRTLLIMTIGFALIVLPVYLWHTWNFSPEWQRNLIEVLKTKRLAEIRDHLSLRVLTDISDIPVLRAIGQYSLGLVMVNQRRQVHEMFYFWGSVRDKGLPSYFPVLYFLKETLAWWFLVLAAITAVFFSAFKGLRRPSMSRARAWMGSHFEECAMLLWLFIYWASAITSTLNIGVRHILPTIPFAIILVSGQIGKLMQLPAGSAKRPWVSAKAAVRTGVVLLLGWQILEIARIHPLYMTYYNELVGGAAKGYTIAVDSNLDWGQDLKRLGNFMRSQGIPTFEAFLFAAAYSLNYYTGYTSDQIIAMPPEKYRADRDFLELNRTNGWLAVSATHKMTRQGSRSANFDWLDAFDPVAIVGNSIFIYHIRSGMRRSIPYLPRSRR